MIIRYNIRHTFEFHYADSVQASVMSLFVHPIRDRLQVVNDFHLQTDPLGSFTEFTDPFGNTGHFFDRPGHHGQLQVMVNSTVEVGPRIPPLPDELGKDGWANLEATRDTVELWPMLHPSRYVYHSPELADFIARHKLSPKDDPLVSVKELSHQLHRIFQYTPGSTQADSPIEHILETGQGVCQDYAHVMASILRHWGIPCRYVSGYLGEEQEESEGESHAWVECWFAELGWTGFDPTNDTLANERHIRVAVGRDYADIPPSRGVFQGQADSTLKARVFIRRQPLQHLQTEG